MYGIFLDIETTGLDPSIHSPIEIACKIFDLAHNRVEGQYESVILQSKEAWEKRDLVSLEINGFSWEEITRGKSISLISQEIIAFFNSIPIQRGSSFFICQNPAFDRGFFNQIIDVYLQERLNWPYHWLDLASMYWATYARKVRIARERLPDAISLSKNEIAKAYRIPEEKFPHRAMRGVEHLMACYEAVMELRQS